ncbi:MAG: phosphoribosylformylglycinamidine synthase I [Phycisphaerae bacterium]|nr:phosphoribosylformylglycinamidine synthase I [Phycisphaerae bacterium]
MAKVNALVLRAAGVNCNEETAYALQLAGADSAEQIHVNRLIEKPAELDRFGFLVVPGGFSYGDDISAGKILARQIELHLGEAMSRFIEAGKLVLGICNGFQVLVKAGLLPGLKPATAGTVTLTSNDSGKYEDRWVHLTPASKHNIFLPASRDPIYLPVAHGEGKLAVREPGVLDALRAADLVAVRYCDAAGAPAAGQFPANPNGSLDDIAGLCNPSGQVFGLMPHPERHVLPTQHPQWTRRGLGEADGLQVFRNGVEFLRGR